MPPMTSGKLRPRDQASLLKLREVTQKMFEKLIESGWKFTAYRCNHCRHLIPTNCPKPTDTGSKGYWDSTTTCLACGRLNFVFVWPSGRTVARKFPPFEGEENIDAEYRGVPVSFEVISKKTCV